MAAGIRESIVTVIGMIDWPAVKRNENSRYAWADTLMGQKKDLMRVIDGDMKVALAIYDSETLEEIERIPMVKAAGKHNAANKTGFPKGTSHQSGSMPRWPAEAR